MRRRATQNTMPMVFTGIMIGLDNSEQYCNGKEIFPECASCRERKWCNLKYIPNGRTQTEDKMRGVV